MGFLSRIFGVEARAPGRAAQGAPPPAADAQAIERYRYMVQTAPPETLEQAHQEAFEKLTPEQRHQVLRELARAAPPHERAAVEAMASDDSRSIARVATRAELRQPGTMERVLGGSGMGFGASLLSSFAAGLVGSMVAQSFFSALHDDHDRAADDDGDGDGDGDGDANSADESETAAYDEPDYTGDEGAFDGDDFDV